MAEGGPAGIGAAYVSAKAAMKTLLIEQFGFLGGMWTVGFVNPIFDHGNKKGVIKLIIQRLKDNYAWSG